jgi:hypothetical protein
LPLEGRLCRVQLRLERLLVHLEHDLARFDDRAFLVDTLVEPARNACLDVDGLHALGLRDVDGGHRDVLALDRQHGHVDRAFFRRLRRLAAATLKEEQAGREDKSQRGLACELQGRRSNHGGQPGGSGRTKFERALG